MPGAVSRFAKFAAIAVLTGTTVFASIGDADARRAGGSGFGSRGTRTFQAPPVTRTAPAPAAPIERSMTPRPQNTAPYAGQSAVNTQRPGLFNGFGRSMIGGLVAGGLLGMLLGHGFGGGFGFLGMLLQIVLIGIAISFAMRFFANRRQPAYGPAAGPAPHSPIAAGGNTSSFRIPSIGTGAGDGGGQTNSKSGDEVGLGQGDLDRFEQLLTEIQTAYGAEDYATLRRLTTPEAMSYLAEELGENATNGVRNKVSSVKLLQGDVAEAWREDGADYATLAMRYSSIDSLVERGSGKLVSGDDSRPTETTEIWTFLRKGAGEWKLAAIQGTEQRAA
ncbi:MULTISPECIES: Tim44 domain-containing protein [unclassified Rhizobium]|uniref:TIM44-like domain-containing protein n=1 Tax=unclassified Rhizobium TaxID=2613769 RepID=UPI001616B8AF|nr:MULTISPECIES: Tim44 domain-containing protein [unclassified Rhizobium]MBB3320274.1 putative lipid-binding transport protein (Tim44 family) [Rhizobium sp. BK181]MCS4096030.1 putative lipid-binding transport protein (Tim44 family) [Rhizobium sp. BK176]